MNFFRSKALPSDTPTLRNREPGHGVLPEEIFEVWGDMIDLSDCDAPTRSRLAGQATTYMYTLLRTLLDEEGELYAGFKLERCSDSKEQVYLLVKGEGLQGEIGVHQLGGCLNLFGILRLPQKWGTDPNPLVRLSRLNAIQRRDVTIFQSLLKYVLDQTAEALDEQRIR
ncbi:MAG: hypothetical protein EOM24_01525 [Chloroflexia bacterium]|nr:hypothetical protein [Chloroflexia bacterium]